MYKVEQEFVYYDEENRVVHQSQHYSYCETPEDTIKCALAKMGHVATTAQVNCIYIWCDGDMLFHAECIDGVWS